MRRRLQISRLVSRPKNGKLPSPQRTRPTSFLFNNNNNNNNNSSSSSVGSGSRYNRGRVRPPGPKGHFLVGVLPEFRQDPAGFLEKIARQYGDVVYLPLGRQHIYCISHPDAIREVLVTHQNKFKKSRMLERARVLL